MSFLLFGESLVTTMVASALSSVIISKLMSRDGVDMTWNYIVRPVGKKAYELVYGRAHVDVVNTNHFLDKLPKGHVVFEVLEPRVDENGVVTRYIIFERKYNKIENEAVHL